MNNTTKDGGPAYPQPQVSDGLGCIEYTEVEGMSLRDWFAGQALVGLMASFSGSESVFPVPEVLASDAYMQADAMLKAREET